MLPASEADFSLSSLIAALKITLRAKRLDPAPKRSYTLIAVNCPKGLGETLQTGVATRAGSREEAAVGYQWLRRPRRLLALLDGFAAALRSTELCSR